MSSDRPHQTGANRRPKVVFGDADKMLQLVGEALAPSKAAKTFLPEFFLTECEDPVGMLAQWAARRKIPGGIAVEHCHDAGELRAALSDADVLVVESAAVSAADIDSAPSLKLIQIFGQDTGLVDLDACRRRGIAVRTLVRHANRLVAEHVVMLMLALMRGLDDSREGLRRPSPLPPSPWAFNWPACKKVRGLAGRTVGLVGLGQVGAMVADYLRPFGVTLMYSKRSRDLAAEARLGIEYVSLVELFQTADVVSLHVPGHAGTRGLVGRDLLQRAKPGLFIVNTSRGLVIDEDALVESLQSGRLGGAALDVFCQEPLPADHPLRRAPNVILTPHVAAGTRDEQWLDREIGPVVEAILTSLGRDGA